jgi:hypothetical protein
LLCAGWKPTVPSTDDIASSNELSSPSGYIESEEVGQITRSCGCVPTNMMPLFQTAQMRAQYRKQKQLELDKTAKSLKFYLFCCVSIPLEGTHHGLER